MNDSFLETVEQGSLGRGRYFRKLQFLMKRGGSAAGGCLPDRFENRYSGVNAGVMAGRGSIITAG
jgi:hypothetical protein